MSRFLVDTSYIVAQLASWSPHHDSVTSQLDLRLSGGESMVVAAHSVAETYSVLSRLPAPHRLSPRDAAHAVKQVLVLASDVIALDGGEYVDLVTNRAPALGVAGGRLYDFLIHACAVKSSAHFLLTLNRRHFEGFPGSVQVVGLGQSEA